MGKVILKIPPFFASVSDLKSSGWFIVETEITESITIRDLLAKIALNNKDFRQAVFNPGDGSMNGNIDIVLNQNFLPFPHPLDTSLIDEDVIILIPVVSGG